MAMPTGTVTFLFTDVEGSTRLVQELGAAGWGPMLGRHRELIRAALAAHAGIEVQTEGDGFFAVFPDPREAVRAVADAQRRLADEPWPAATPVRVRMGLHTGDGVLDPEGLYVGPDVHRAARVASSGNGGQVVLSATTAALVASALPPGLRLRPLGEHRLKDLRPEQLWDLVVEGLPSDFPPIRSLDARPNNLPTQLTSFVGRERELAEARDLLLRNRLLTLTGPGGTGKTRLSLQLAASVAEDYPGGIWFVPLATVTDPALVLDTIAHALGVPEAPGRSPLDGLVEALAGLRVLLVLDNLEQVVASAPDLAALLRALPDVSIVASSRAVLRISGEQEYAIAGLPAPPDLERLTPSEQERLGAGDRARDPETIAGFEAIRLFVTRAQAVRPGFAITTENAAAVAAICARLEGMPLAIELAAARVRALPPAAILGRLGHQLDLLATGSRDLPERQRSLRGAIAWSHDLLDEPCRRLLERLAVFMGGFTLDDAEVVGGPADELGQDVLDGLGSLVDQSLVRLDDAGPDPRYHMLEPIREFALEELETRGEVRRIRDRHAARMVDVLERAAPELTGPDQRRWLDRLERDLGNHRAALEHARATGDVRTALRFVAAIWRFWQIRGHLVQGVATARDVIATPGSEAFPEERLAALEALGGLAWWAGDYASCLAAYEEVLAARRRQGDELAIARALYNVAFPLIFGPGAHDRSKEALEEAQELFRRHGDADGVARTWWGIANVMWTSRRLDEARAAARRAVEHFRSADLRFDLAWGLFILGQSELVAGDGDAAARLHLEALDLFEEADDVAGVVMSLDALAIAARLQGDRERAARLSGAVARHERWSGTGLNAANRKITGFEPEELRADPSTARAWSEGEAMDLAAAVAEARAGARETDREPG